jgi:hypothetical protein
MTATIIPLPRVAAAPGRTDTDIPVLEPDPFMSLCPTCKDVRVQRGYTRRSLIRLLIRNHPIGAHCVICDQSWPLGANERAELERRLGIAENTTGRLAPYGPASLDGGTRRTARPMANESHVDPGRDTPDP